MILSKLLDPAEYARNPSELAQQTAVIMWAAQVMASGRLAELRWLHAVPNGGSRVAAEASRLKASGVKRGVFDLALPVRRLGYAGLYIEMKRQGGVPSDVSDDQFDWLEHYLYEGYAARVCYGYHMAIITLKAYCESDSMLTAWITTDYQLLRERKRK